MKQAHLEADHAVVRRREPGVAGFALTRDAALRGFASARPVVLAGRGPSGLRVSASCRACGTRPFRASGRGPSGLCHFSRGDLEDKRGASIPSNSPPELSLPDPSASSSATARSRRGGRTRAGTGGSHMGSAARRRAVARLGGWGARARCSGWGRRQRLRGRALMFQREPSWRALNNRLPGSSQEGRRVVLHRNGR